MCERALRQSPPEARRSVTRRDIRPAPAVISRNHVFRKIQVQATPATAIHTGCVQDVSVPWKTAHLERG